MRASKRLKSDGKASLLNLHVRVPWKDVRRIIYSHWTPFDLKMVRYAHHRDWKARIQADPEICHEIAAEGHLELLQWATEIIGCKYHSGILYDITLAAGHLDIFKWLCAKMPGYKTRPLDQAARNGCVHILQYALFGGFKGIYDTEFSVGTLEVLKWAKFNRLGLRWHTIETRAIRTGDLSILQWLKNETGHIFTNIRHEAMLFNQTRVIQWLDENNRGV